MKQVKYSYQEVFDASLDYFKGDELAAKVFADKYALQDRDGKYDELTPVDMHRRLAKEFARIESNYPNPMSEEAIFNLFDHFKYIIPQGSPMSAIGNPYQVQSISNCFVVENPYDSYGGILKTDQELAQISKRRGGVGVNISSIRPKGIATANAAKTTDGIGVFMERFSNTIREVGQCIAKGQRVLTKRGLVAIENVIANQDLVWTKQGWVIVTDVVANGNKEIVKTTAASGLSIETSRDHVVLSINNKQIVEKTIDQLNSGDHIVTLMGTDDRTQQNRVKLDNYQFVARGTNGHPVSVKQPNCLSVDLAYYLGYSYGDGSVSYDKFHEACMLSLACSNDWPEIKAKLSEIAHSEFDYKIRVRQGDGALEALQIQSKELLGWLARNNILKQKGDVMIFPQAIINSLPDVQAAFLAGYFDADGYASGKKKGYIFASVNKQFLNDVQKILMSLGIVSKFHVEKRDSLGWQDLYSLAIGGESSQKAFVNQIKSVKVASSNHVSKRDCVISAFTAKALGVKQGKNTNFVSNTDLLSVACIDRLITEGVITDPGHLVADKIADKQIVGIKETYDLVLEKEHLFWCEGFYVHNSGRRGALMITCSIHHPEVRTFINIKKDLKKVTGANISLQITDEFMNAVRNNQKYQLRWPVDVTNPTISEEVDAKEMWDEIIVAAHGSAEPGVLFWTTALNRTPADIYTDVGFGSICVNPCAELILSKSDSCRLLLLNLMSYVQNPFSSNAMFDFNLFNKHAQIAQRLMDDLVDLELEAIENIIKKVQNDPEPMEVKKIELDLWRSVKEACSNGRRTGTGITALGDCLAALNIKYGSKESITVTEQIYKELCLGCYKSTAIMAGERGAFPVYSFEKETGHVFLEQIWEADPNVYEIVKKNGRRNIALTTTAPTGSVSTLTRTTSGIEPAFMLSYIRRKKINPEDKNARIDFVDPMGDSWQEFTVYHHGLKQWMDVTGETDVTKSPYYGATSNEIDWQASVKLQGAAQRWTDHAISKTCNLPNDTTVDVVKDVYMMAWEQGCKGFTVYRDGCRSGVLVSEEAHKAMKARDPMSRPEGVEVMMAPKRPTELPCDIKKAKVQGEGWTIFVGMLNSKPYEVFGGLSKYVDIPNRYKHGRIVKNGKVEGVTAYNLIVGEDDDEMVIKNIASVFENATYGAFTRTISLALRHGCPPQFVMEQLQKDKFSDMTSFSRVMGRVLKSYITDGTKAASDKTCTSCGKEAIVYQEGCLKCLQCGYSKCG